MKASTSLTPLLSLHLSLFAAKSTGYSSPRISVGFHVGLDSSTAVIAWPNGTFSDAVNLPTDPGDRRWRLATDTLLPPSLVQKTQPRDVDDPSGPVQGLNYGPDMPFLGSLVELKRLTNDVLGTEEFVTAVAYPAFLMAYQLDQLRGSVHAADVRDSKCHGTATSCPAAAIAYRRQQSAHLNSSPVHHVYGEIGKEHLICIDYSRNILTMESLELVVDGRSVYTDEKKSMTVLHKSGDETLGCFWDRVTRHLHNLLEPSIDIQYPERVYRLVLSGRDVADTHLLQALSNVADELVPSPGLAVIPHAARMVFPTYPRWKELWDETPRRKWPGITCVYDYNPWESQENLYGNALYQRISRLSHTSDDTVSQVSIDPVFASARGAALMGIASLIRPCNKSLPCAFADCAKTQAKTEGWELDLHFVFSSDLAERKRRNETEFEILRNWPVSNATKERVQAYYRENWLGQNSFRVARKKSFSLREDIKKRARLMWWWFWFR